MIDLRLVIATMVSVLMCAATQGTASVDAAPAVDSFAPEGVAKQVRQVTARFTVPMVALGDPQLPDPFEIQCDAAGKGRWADTRNWVYDFEADLPAGVRCRFSLHKNLKAQSGLTVGGTQSFAFSTGGPAIVRSIPNDGEYGVDEEQVFLLKLDAAAATQSVEDHARCVVPGLGEEIPVQVLAGATRRSILRERRALGYQYFRLLWKDGAVSDVRVRDREMERAEAEITVLRCQRRLPPASPVQLLWGSGIKTSSGVATTTEQRLTFRVRPAFIARAECTRANARAGCLPMLPITLRFDAPVPRQMALGVRLRLANGKQVAPVAPPESQGNTLDFIEFAAPFLEKQPVSIVLPPKLTDDAGRALENAARFPLSVRVDESPPLAKFSSTFGILEANEGGVLPVTLRNVETALPARQTVLPANLLRLKRDPAAIASWLRRVEAAGEAKGERVAVTPAERAEALAAKPHLGTDEEEGDESEVDPGYRWREDTGTQSVFSASDSTEPFTLSKPAGQKTFEVVGIPLKNPGFYVVEIESRILGQSLLGRDQVRYVATSALVTDLAVHFKWGRETSIAWVTRLHDGVPVAGANVIIVNYCSGAVVWQGATDQNGIAAVPQSLGTPHSGLYCYAHIQEPLLVAASKDADFSFTTTGWDQGIEPGQFNLPLGSEVASRTFHTVLDRALFRAGETVSMKHFMRRHVMAGFAQMDNLPGQRTVIIAHQGSGQRYTLTASFDRDGIAESEWKIPAEAKLGQYLVYIGEGDSESPSGTFRVEQFRLPSMRASVSGSAIPLVNPKSLDLDLHVAYMAGGGAGGIAVKVRSLVQSRPLHFPAYGDYEFGGKAVAEGVVSNNGGSRDDESEDEANAPQGETPSGQVSKTQVIPLTLDSTGSSRVSIPDLPALSGAAVLTAELEYADADGELLTSIGHVQLVPAAVAVGIRREGWVASSDQVRFGVVVLDLNGQPQARAAVNVVLYQSKQYSFRKRLIGGFYAYESSTETKKLPARCQGETDAQGRLSCEVAPGVSGEILIRAESIDSSGRVSGATASVWVFDGEESWFGGTSGDRMDVLPEKKSYEAGERARFQVRMPFREATALVTVERQGVMSSFVTHIDSKQPVIEVPIERNYAPNIFVSVLAVRGRVAHAEHVSTRSLRGGEITTLVDLNKPAYRLGIAAIKVGWTPHRLEVRVAPQRSTYKVRESADVKVHVARADGGALPAGTEVAVVAVDAALLELQANPSWELLSAMMGERGLEVYTSTAQMQVVGKRHYGRKAVTSGGGGGRDRARELFDSLLYWKGRVSVNAEGNALVRVPLNDSLSEFRIVAIANGDAGFFGTGSATINTTQDLMLLSGLPPLVREGDQYLATFTLRNMTDHTINAQVSGSKSGVTTQPLAPQRVAIAAGQSQDVAWRVVAPLGSAALRWEVTAKEVGGPATDRIRVNEQVIPAVPVRTYQATISQLAEPLSMPVARPAAAIPGRGGIEVTLRAHLGDGLDGVREYMRLYPYGCIEQRLSQAVVLRDKAAWVQWMERLPAYLDGDGLVRYFPSDWLAGDDALTAYVLQIADESGWPVPELARNRMLDALKRFVQGRLVRGSALPTADLTIRKLAAIETLSRFDQANNAMLDSLTIEPNLWPTSAVLDWVGILRRVGDIPEAAKKQSVALQALRVRLNFQGTVMSFSTEHTDALWWLMISSDSNANRMLLAVLDRPEWREDIPRLVRGALARQQFGHWNTTVANAWGALAMEKFSAQFESVPVTGTSTVRYGNVTQPTLWRAEHNSQSMDLPWQEGTVQFNVSHAGSGRPWVMLRATAAMPLSKPISSGYRIKRIVSPLEQKQPGHWSRGDVLRVRLELDAQSDMSWVVVDDPLPAGSSILGSGLGGSSQLLTRNERREGMAWPAYEERRFDAFRTYYRFVPKGQWVVEYTVRLNNPGTFLQPSTRVEAMYAPEQMGEMPNAPVVVER